MLAAEAPPSRALSPEQAAPPPEPLIAAEGWQAAGLPPWLCPAMEYTHVAQPQPQQQEEEEEAHDLPPLFPAPGESCYASLAGSPWELALRMHDS